MQRGRGRCGVGVVVSGCAGGGICFYISLCLDTISSAQLPTQVHGSGLCQQAHPAAQLTQLPQSQDGKAGAPIATVQCGSCAWATVVLMEDPSLDPPRHEFGRKKLG